MDEWFKYLPGGIAKQAWWNFFTERPKSRDQYSAQSVMSGLSPAANGYYNYRDNMAYMDDYMSNRGLDYSNIKYPSRTDGWYGGNSLGYGIRQLSRNVESLYTKGSSAPRRRSRR